MPTAVSINTRGVQYIELEYGWNMISIPTNQSINNTDLMFNYDGTDYNWAQATTNNNPTGGPIILGFIYGWDETNQIYILSDDFDPGYGYWMYAYYMCTLKK